MSFYVINCEYDIDLAVKECIKLMSFEKSKVKLAFNNMNMVKIFMEDLTNKCEAKELDPEETEFHMDVLVELPNEENLEGGGLDLEF